MRFLDFQVGDRVTRASEAPPHVKFDGPEVVVAIRDTRKFGPILQLEAEDAILGPLNTAREVRIIRPTFVSLVWRPVFGPDAEVAP